MTPTLFNILTLLGLTLVGFLATAAGIRLARARSHLWLLGFILPLAVIALIIVGRRMPQYALVFPISWVLHYRVTPWLMAALVPILLATLAGKLHKKSQKISLTVLMILMFIYYALVPIIAPLIGQMQLAGHATKFDRRGVCRQTSEFSCGAAAAVNALRVVGISADEETLAREALTGPAVGTDPIALVDAINRLYASQGVHASYIRLTGERLDFPSHIPIILSISTGLLTNHYITVVGLRPADAGVFVADPEQGLRAYPWGFLSGTWHGMGITLHRDQPTVVALTANPVSVSK